jgi:uncharacterized protein DUF4389
VRHPVRLVVRDDLRRRRATVALRPVLALPHLLLVTAWAAAVVVLLPAQWLGLLVRGRPFRLLDAANLRFARYGVAVVAYALLLAEPWPRLAASAYPVGLEVDRAYGQRRVTVLVRPALVLPGAVFASVLAVVAIGVAIVAWFAGVTRGTISEGLAELGVYCLRFDTQVVGYAILLTEAPPSLAGATGLVILPREAR